MSGDILKRERIVATAVALSAVSGIVLSVHFLIQGQMVTFAVLVLCFSIACCIGALLHMARPDNKETAYRTESASGKTRIPKAIGLAFYVSLITGLIIASESLYVKPISYYLAVSAASLFIALQIVFMSDRDAKQCSFVLFLQILPLAVLLRASSFLSNPYLIGPDTYWHYHSIENVISASQLNTTAYHYYRYPAHILMQSLCGVVVTLSETTSNVINAVTSVVSVLVGFTIGRALFRSNRAGLMAALVVSVSTMLIFLVDYNTSKIGGATLFMVCVLALVMNSSRKHAGMTFVFWISAATLFFWHPEVSASLIAVLVGGYVASVVTGRRLVSIYGLAGYVIAFVAYMALINVNLFGNVIEGFFIETSPGLIQNFEGRAVTYLLVLQLAVAYFGMSALIFFATGTIIDGMTLSDDTKTLFSFSILGLMAVPTFGVLSGTFSLNPERTFVYFSTLITIASANAIARSLNPLKVVRTFLMLCLIGFFCFASISSYLIGDGNEVFNNTIPHGGTYTTESNLMSHEFLLLLPEWSTVNSDYGTLRYTTDSLRGIYDLPRVTLEIFPLVDERAFTVLNFPNLEMLVWTETTWGYQVNNITLTHDLVFSNGDVKIFSGDEVSQ